MRKLYLFSLLALAGSILGLSFVWAEQITLSTYYPAPYGVYKTMQANTLYLQPIDRTTVQDPKDGMLICDSTDDNADGTADNKIKFWDSTVKNKDGTYGAWCAFVSFLEEVIEMKGNTLEGDFTLSPKKQNILNPDKIDIGRKGLYSLSCDGRIDIKAPAEKTATIEVYRGKKQEYTAEYEDDADTDPKTYTTHNISEGSFLFLQKGTYSFKVKGYCQQGVEDAFVQKGFTIQLKLLLPL